MSLWHSGAGDLNCRPPPCTASSLSAEPSLQHLRCLLSADAGDACKLSRLAPPALSSMSAVFAFMVSCALNLWFFCFARVTVSELSTQRNTTISGGGTKNMPRRGLFLNRYRSILRNGFQMAVGDVRAGKGKH